MEKEITKLGAEFPGDTHQKQKKSHSVLKQEYKQWLSVKNFKPRGIEEKLRHIDYFFFYLQENSLDVKEITYTKACTYREYLATRKNERGLPRFCSASINVQLASLGTLYRYLTGIKAAGGNPFAETERIRETEHLPKTVLTIKEMGILLSSLPAVTKEDVKAKTAVEALYATGMRITELENIRLEDCDMNRGVLYVRDDKERQDRMCVLTEYAHKVLDNYLKHNTSVFPFRHGEQRSFNRFLNNRLKRECEKLGLSALTCHGIRHTAATHLLKKGADLREVQEFLGHKRIRNTEKYTRLTHEDLKKVVDSHHPREREQA